MTAGVICLQGGGEFGPGCRDMDAELVEPAAVAAIDAAAMLFLPGGSPGRLLTTLSRPALRDALQRLLGRGGVLAGASAGAMVLAELTLLPSASAPRGRAGRAVAPRGRRDPRPAPCRGTREPRFGRPGPGLARYFAVTVVTGDRGAGRDR